MQKWLIGLLILLLTATLLMYVFIPAQLKISHTVVIKANKNAVLRYLSASKSWTKWWPEKALTPMHDSSFAYNNFLYRPTQVYYNSVDVEIRNRRVYVPGKMVVIPVQPDSIHLEWNCELSANANPINRLLHINTAKNIKANMEEILASMKNFAENKDNVYGFHIQHSTLQDTTLVSTKITTNHYPTTPEIYAEIGKLKQYISTEGAKETNYPMLNITTNDSITYTTMVAIATNSALAGKGDIAFKRMIVYKDKLITADVKGGPVTIKEAYKEVDQYLNDYNLTQPVIHWENLITDRQKEPDSSKWVTKICIPIV